MKMLRFTLLFAYLFIPYFAEGTTFIEKNPNPLHPFLSMEDPKTPYSAVVDCGSVSQAELFRRARLWLVQALANDPLALSDPQTGDLVGRLKQVVTLPRTENSAGGVYRFRSTVVIECANRKYRIQITRIELEDNGNSQLLVLDAYRQKMPSVYAELDKQLQGILASLQHDVTGYKPF